MSSEIYFQSGRIIIPFQLVSRFLNEFGKGELDFVDTPTIVEVLGALGEDHGLDGDVDSGSGAITLSFYPGHMLDGYPEDLLKAIAPYVANGCELEFSSDGKYPPWKLHFRGGKVYEEEGEEVAAIQWSGREKEL